jgi:hypothetical protein
MVSSEGREKIGQVKIGTTGSTDATPNPANVTSTQAELRNAQAVVTSAIVVLTSTEAVVTSALTVLTSATANVTASKAAAYILSTITISDAKLLKNLI